ncbi:unnamed protein product [Didymodactylos carnosus]|uniref:Uncharacterized protein n=1 Tax=Didymodactylos carnosus TaxID=1234261 RepID=A0A813WKB3_9BILA|nr:unnamed protein product [Didymodactylos carnosus]CAF3642636.1 unnamed protein product [Didymodactylos carnosus]
MSWTHRTIAKLSPSPNHSNLESSQSSSSILITPIVSTPTPTTTVKSSSIFSPFERRLAKYRSLPLLWLRTCGNNRRRSKDLLLATIDLRPELRVKFEQQN